MSRFAGLNKLTKSPSKKLLLLFIKKYINNKIKRKNIYD